MSTWTVATASDAEICRALAMALSPHFRGSFSVAENAVLWTAPAGHAGYTFERIQAFAQGYIVAAVFTRAVR